MSIGSDRRVCDEVVSLPAITVREIVNAVARLRAR